MPRQSAIRNALRPLGWSHFLRKIGGRCSGKCADTPAPLSPYFCGQFNQQTSHNKTVILTALTVFGRTTSCAGDGAKLR